MEASDILTIDRGNTRLKLTFWKDNLPIESQTVDCHDLRYIDILLSRYKPNYCGYCSVVSEDEVFKAYLTNRFGENLLVVDSETKMLFRSLYSQGIGVDRLCGIAGAIALHPETALLVIDAGSAVTYDIVDEGGVHVGGFITPGIKLRSESLHEYCSLLPATNPQGIPLQAPVNTRDAIESGILTGIVGEIREISEQSKRRFGCNIIVFTGGDGKLLMELTERKNKETENSTVSGKEDIHYEYVSNLVERGIKEIFDYNRVLQTD